MEFLWIVNKKGQHKLERNFVQTGISKKIVESVILTSPLRTSLKQSIDDEEFTGTKGELIRPFRSEVVRKCWKRTENQVMIFHFHSNNFI